VFKCNSIKLEEIKKLVKIAKLSFPQTNNYSKSYFEKYYFQYPEGFILAKDNNKIIGYVVLQLFKDNSAKIISLAVVPNYQRRGVGSFLLKCSFNKLKKKKVDKIILHVRIKNKKAINFHQKFNFKILKIVRNYYSNGEDAYLMSKLI